ncbi:hypothetical protein ABMX15_18880 [Klebsiella variicola]|uniref:hypothetical protein n=1 Tax=Klebsiella variicola TaxID=244366 RepID=UPI0032C40E6C
MKTFNQLKSLIDFCQTDAFSLEHLNRPHVAGVIYFDDGNIDTDRKTVSDDFMIALPACTALSQK